MRIFFVAYEGADVVCIRPVLRALVADGTWEPVFVPGTDFKAERGLAEADAPGIVPVRSLRDPLADAADAAAGERVLDRARALGAALTASPVFESRAAGAAIERVFARPYMAEVCARYEAVERALSAFARDERPALVVLPEDTDYIRGRLAARVLQSCGAVIVCLVPWFYGAFLSNPLLGTRWADQYLVPTSSYAERLLAGGVAADRITVVGDPAFDTLPSALARPSQPGSLLYALQGLVWEREIVADLIEIVRSDRKARLRIKPHPRLPFPAWLRDIELAGRVAIVEQGADLHDLLRETTAVIGQSSKMLYEASILGRPVIVPHYDTTPLLLDLPAEDRGHIVARTKGALRHKVERALDGHGRPLTIAAIAPHHPHATQRVVERLDGVRKRLAGGHSSGV